MAWRSIKAFGLPLRPLSKLGNKVTSTMRAKRAHFFFPEVEISKQSNRCQMERHAMRAQIFFEFLQSPWAGPDQGPAPRSLGCARPRTPKSKRRSPFRLSEAPEAQGHKVWNLPRPLPSSDMDLSSKDLARGQLTRLHPG